MNREHRERPRMRIVGALLLLLLSAPVRPTFADDAVGNAARGRKLYQSCLGCHSVDEDDVGPRHRGVVGRRAGSVPGYAYSEGLRRSGIVWTPATLDRWLANPQAFVPGSKMFFSMADQHDRADVIAYLATLGNP